MKNIKDTYLRDKAGSGLTTMDHSNKDEDRMTAAEKATMEQRSSAVTEKHHHN